MRNVLIGISAALVLVAGGVAAVALFTTPTLAVAQTDNGTEAENPHPKLERAREWLLEATTHLVPDVISADQQAAVVDAIVDAGVEQFREKAEDVRNRARRVLTGAFTVAAETIGIETESLVSQVREEGKTIAQVASENGADPQAVVDALAAAAEEAIDERVAQADRDIDPERLAQFKANVREMIERFVAGDYPDRDKVQGFFHRFGGHGEEAGATN